MSDEIRDRHVPDIFNEAVPPGVQNGLQCLERGISLGYHCSLSGMRPSADKRAILLAIPEPRDEVELFRSVGA